MSVKLARSILSDSRGYGVLVVGRVSSGTCGAVKLVGGQTDGMSAYMKKILCVQIVRIVLFERWFIHIPQSVRSVQKIRPDRDIQYAKSLNTRRLPPVLE